MSAEIQIQHLLKLNFKLDDFDKQYINSNTTLVKVKYNYRVY